MLGMTADPSGTTPKASRSERAGPGPRSTRPDGTRTASDGAGEDHRRSNGSRRSWHREVDVHFIAGETGVEESVSFSMLPVPRPRPDDRGPDSARRSDVDEWGRSEHMRSVVRRLYDPVYRYWFRVEWEGLEKIPLHGGALLIANHAGAIPSDAPAIMHGIEEELGRPVYGMADYFFRTIPVVGTTVVAHRRGSRPPGQCLPSPPRPTATGPGVPRGDQGHLQDLQRSLPAATGSGGVDSWRSP